MHELERQAGDRKEFFDKRARKHANKQLPSREGAGQAGLDGCVPGTLVPWEHAMKLELGQGLFNPQKRKALLRPPRSA